MAKIKWSGIISDASGSLGGVFFQKIQGSSCVSKSYKPLTAFTDVHSRRLRTFANIATSWHSLPSSVVNAWRSFNYLGSSGYNAFMKLNIRLRVYSVTGIVNPPVLVKIPLIKSVLVTASHSTGILVYYSFSFINSSYRICYEFVKAVAPGCRIVDRMFISNGSRPYSDASPRNISGGYTSRFGSLPPVGYRFAVRVFLLNTVTGQSTPSVLAMCIVTV